MCACRSWGELLHMWNKAVKILLWLQKKLHVICTWTVSSDVTQWICCIVGIGCTWLWKSGHWCSTLLTLLNLVWKVSKQMFLFQHQQKHKKRISYFTHSSCFSKPGTYCTLPTMHPRYWVIIGAKLCIKLYAPFVWVYKRLWATFFTYAVERTKTCKHALMCKTGGVILLSDKKNRHSVLIWDKLVYKKESHHLRRSSTLLPSVIKWTDLLHLL